MKRKLLAGILSLLFAGQALAQGTTPTFTTVNVTNRLTHTALVATPVSASMTNGATVAYPATNSIMTLNVSGTIATGRVTLPTTASIASGFIVRIASTGTVTALTVSPAAGQNTASLPTSITPLTPVNLYWDGASTTWRVLTGGSGLYSPNSVAITGGTIAGTAISGGTISGTAITGSTGAFSTLSATTLTVSGTASGPGFGALFASPADIGTTAPAQGYFTNLNVSGTISGAAFDNIADFASPPVLGSTSPNTVHATNLTASGTVSGAGFASLLASPPGPIGSGTPVAGTFAGLTTTSLTASGTVSGAGITALFASPGPIGTTLPSTALFTALEVSTTVTGAGFTTLFASPGPIGSTAPSTGAFTTLSASGAVSGAGFVSRFSSPGPVGDTTPSTGAFTTLSASGAVSGAGFVSRFSSPGPIGDVAASTGAFTTLSTTSTATLGSASAARVVISGGATETNGGAGVISTAGTDTDTHLMLTTKNANSILRTNRPFLQSTSSDLNTLDGLRSPYTYAWFHNNTTYAGAMASRFSVSGTLGGTITGSNFAVNDFIASSDNTNAASSGGLSYLYVGASAGGSVFKGNRTGITAKVLVNTASPNQDAFRFITGLSGGGYASVNPATGVGYGYDETDGYLFGGLLQARAQTGARFVRALQGLELNVGNEETLVPVLDMGGIQVVMENNDVGPWMRQANAYGFANQTAWTGQGWHIGFAYQQANGQFGLNRTYGTVLGGVDTQYGSAPATAFGVDFINLATSQAQFRGYQSNSIIDGSGNIGGQVVAGTTLQTRSGVIARSAAVSTVSVVDGSLFLTKPTLTVTAPPGGGTQAVVAVDTMAAAYMREPSGGTGYTVGDTITLAGGMFTSAAVLTVEEEVGGVPKRLRVTTPGVYTVLPTAPISTSTSGAGTGLTMSMWWTALTVAVSTPGDSYPQYPPPSITATYTLDGGDRSPLRRMVFNVSMTPTTVPLVLNSGSSTVATTFSATTLSATGTSTLGNASANYGTITGGAASAPWLFTAVGSDTNIGIGLLPKGGYPVTATKLLLAPTTSWVAGSANFVTRVRPQLQVFTASATTPTGTGFYPQFSVSGGTQSGYADVGGAGLAYMNNITVDSDNVIANSGSGPQGLALLGINLGVGNSAGTAGGAHKGGRNAIAAEIFVNSDVDIGAGSLFHVGVAGGVTAHYKLGGVPGANRGNVFGSNVWARARNNSGPGPRYLNSLVGMEVGVRQEEYVSALWKIGLQIVEENSSAANAIQQNIALSINNQSSATTLGWDQAIAIGAYNGQFPMKAGGQLMASVPTPNGLSARATADGINFTGITFSRAAFESAGFYVDGSGNVGGATVGGVALQTTGAVSAGTSGVASATVVDGGLYLAYPTIERTGTFGSGVTTIAVSSGTNISNGMVVTGTGIDVGTTVVSGGGTSSLVISLPTTSAETDTDLDFNLANLFPTFALSAPPTAGSTATLTVTTMGASSFAGVVAGGSGYTAGDVLTIVGGTGTAGTVYVETVNGSGQPVNVRVDSAGSYTALAPNPVSFTGGTGSGYRVNMMYTALTASTTAGAGYSPLVPPTFTKTGLSSFTKEARFNIAMAAATPKHMTLNSGSTVGIPMATPASATATCTTGTITFDSSFFYACVATDTWKRAALATWP